MKLNNKFILNFFLSGKTTSHKIVYRNSLALTASRLGLLGKNYGILWQFQGTYVVYRACGHDEGSFTVKGDGTERNHPTLKCSNKRHWSFAQIFIKWLKDKARAKPFSESWTLLLINWQFKIFYSISLHQNGRNFDYKIDMLCVCLSVRACTRTHAVQKGSISTFGPIDRFSRN